MHVRDVFTVVRKLPRYPSILIVMIVQGATGLFIGAALLPLFPEFGNLLGLDDSGLGYGLLIVSMAAGAVIGGISLEAIGRIRTGVGLAVGAAIVYAACLLIFAVSREYLISLPMLLLAGFALIWSESSGQTVVQLDAPADERGRFVGASSVTGFGFRAGSGVLVGILGGIVGVSGALLQAPEARVVGQARAAQGMKVCDRDVGCQQHEEKANEHHGKSVFKFAKLFPHSSFKVTHDYTRDRHRHEAALWNHRTASLKQKHDSG